MLWSHTCNFFGYEIFFSFPKKLQGLDQVHFKKLDQTNTCNFSDIFWKKLQRLDQVTSVNFLSPEPNGQALEIVYLIFEMFWNNLLSLIFVFNCSIYCHFLAKCLTKFDLSKGKLQKWTITLNNMAQILCMLH